MAKVEEFVSKVLFARDRSHLAHWKTRNFSEHMALGEFYESVLDLIDTFVEQYQGYYNELLNVSLTVDEVALDIKTLLDRQVEWIESNRYEVCETDETALQNTIDEVVRQYQHTLYKLRFLK